ncbi:MAG TPA: DUF4386 domain-containing protein [Thermoanaerobaculia bacterium]|nr:DUF4386 domain-containing protein [Thermoanaerobaculia bacterium]
MTDRGIELSPQTCARIGGALYLIIIVSGVLGELLVRGKLVVPGDATATLDNIRSFEFLWRLGIAANLFHLACSVALGLIFYVLLRPVSRDLALLAVLFNLVAITLESASKLFLLPSLFVLGNASYLQAFTPEQLHVLAYLSNRLHTYGFNISLIFFGFECLLLGYVIFKAQFLPKILGILMQIAGVSYLTNSFALLLAPTLVNIAVLVPAFIAELSLALWLLVRGVNVQKWQPLQRLDPGASQQSHRRESGRRLSG